MESNKGRVFLTSRYLTALLAPLFVAGLMETTWPFFQQYPVSPYLLAVIISASYGGLGPGLLSVAVSVVLSNVFFIQPYFSFRFNNPGDVTRLFVFTVVGVFITLLCELTLRARHRARVNLETAIRAERSLREKERFLNQIAGLSPVVINVFDLATRRDVYITPDVVNLTGYTPEEITEMDDPFGALWHPEDITPASDILERVKHARDGEIAELEYRVRRRDGNWRWVATRIMPFERDEHGIVRQVITASVDITEAKETENARRESELQYESLVHSIDGIVWAVDVETFRFTFVSNQAERILGYPVEQWLEPNFWVEHLHIDDRDRALRFCVDATAQKRDHQFEYRMIAADGRVVWLRDIVTVHVSEGRPTRLSGVMVDITDRKREENALRAAEQKYRDIFESSVEGIFQRTPEGRLIVVNPALARMFGFNSPEEMIRERADISRQHYVDATKHEELKRLLEEAGLVRDFEYAAFRKDGSIIWVSNNVRAVRDPDGTIYYEGSTQDITERKRSHERLQEYEKAVEGVEEMIVVIDDAYRYRLANRAYLRNQGLKKEELSGRLVSELIDKHAFETVIKKNLERCFQGHVVKYEMKYTYPETGERDLFISYFPIQSSNGVDRLACVLQDITERKQAEQRLAYHARLLEQVHDAILAVDDRLKLTAWNHAAEQMYGWAAEEVLGRDIRDVLRSNEGESEWAEALRVVARAGRYKTESIHRHKDCSEIHVEGTIMALRNDSGQNVGFAFAYHDISERRRAEQALRSYPRRLIEAQEAERQSISRELHDQIGQVLTAIRINLETIGKGADVSNSQLLIAEGVAIVDQALKQVRDLSFELRPSLLDDLGLASALRWYADRYAQRAGISVTTAIKVPGDTRLPRDLETACFRIVQEALTNVARHAQAENVHIALRALRKGLSLSIKDDGIGFDERSGDANGSPHRLGLQGMRERALALGGKLNIESVFSKGTEIRVHFPNGTKRD